MQNYRSFVKHSSEIWNDINKIDCKLTINDLDTDEFAVEAIKRSKNERWL